MKQQKKMRIQQFDTEGNQLSDRLLTQETEFYTGPKEVHKGPIKIEVCLFDQGDISGVITYLNKISGNIPLKQKSTKGKKPIAPGSELNTETRENILEYLKTLPSQDDIINHLRDAGFVFMMTDRLQELTFGDNKLKVNIAEKDQKKYQWMIHCIREAKDPRNDKYDPNLIIGIDLLNKEAKFMVVYLHKERQKSVKVSWAKKSKASFVNSELINFPKYMIADEREKWRIEHRLLLNHPTKKPSKFYLRWEPDVKVGNKIKREIQAE